MSLNIVLSYQNSAPQSFQNAMQAAANILDSLILNNITVNIQVTYDISLGTSAEGGDFYGLGPRWRATKPLPPGINANLDLSF
jgi:hypothetical protein